VCDLFFSFRIYVRFFFLLLIYFEIHIQIVSHYFNKSNFTIWNMKIEKILADASSGKEEITLYLLSDGVI
jgi:hypothetical protein